MSKRTAVFLLLLLGSFLLSWGLFHPNLLNSWNLQLNDRLFRLRYLKNGPLRTSPYVVHVDIDDASVKESDTFVESGSRYERIIDILTEAEVGGIIFDIVLRKSSDVEGWKKLVSSAQNSGRVYFPVVLREKIQGKDNEKGIEDAPFPESQLWRLETSGRTKPVDTEVLFSTSPELLHAAKGVGHITSLPDREDGVYRRYRLLYPYRGAYIPSLMLRAVCDFLGVTQDRIEVVFGKHMILRGAEFPDGRTKDITIPIDSEGRMIINFCGKWEDETFAHYSLNRLVEIGEDDMQLESLMDDIEESLVLVADISGAKDVGPIPLEEFYQKPGLHSNVASSILTEQFVRAMPAWENLMVDVILMIILLGVALRLGARGFAAAAVILFVGFLALTVWLFIYHDILMNSARSAVGIMFSLVTVASWKYLDETRAKEFIRARFESYFAPSLLNKILQSPDILKGREKKNVTILFSDIKGFTAWSASRQPEEIHQTLNNYFEAMSEIVFKHDGTIDKFIGDGLMVFFGDPIEHKDHPLRAVKAAVEMQKKVRELRACWEPEGRMAIQVRIGINTGDAVVGNMGSHKRVDYTAIGAHVNLAQRLESNAPVGGILVSRSVYDAVRDQVESRPAGKIRAKGFEHEIEVYEVVV